MFPIDEITFGALAILALATILVLSVYISVTEKEERKLLIENGRIYFSLIIVLVLAIGIISKSVIMIIIPLMIFAASLASAEAERQRYYEEEEEAYFSEETEQPVVPRYLVYKGDELQFTNEDISAMLKKRFAYFSKLDAKERDIFLYRIQKFLDGKTFFIYDESGFREMPVLICASAIALSFGLQKFELKSITEIHIFPDAFVLAYPFPRALEGNVTGCSLSLSWKHFLDGCQYPQDGQNVGLHELAHAYQQEFCASPLMIDYGFISSFNEFKALATDAIVKEKLSEKKLYAEYGLQNIDEFWASSVELFFEKPLELKIGFPKIYSCIKKRVFHKVCQLEVY